MAPDTVLTVSNGGVNPGPRWEAQGHRSWDWVGGIAWRSRILKGKMEQSPLPHWMASSSSNFLFVLWEQCKFQAPWESSLSPVLNCAFHFPSHLREGMLESTWILFGDKSGYQEAGDSQISDQDTWLSGSDILQHRGQRMRKISI